MEQSQFTKVGIGVIVRKGAKILLAKRKGSHGIDEYAGPGGHLEYMESVEECAKRETLEETGIQIDNIQFLCLTNLKDYYPKHYIDIGLTADWVSGEPQVLEPDKAESWDWYELDNLPTPLFSTVKNYISAINTAQNFWDN